MSKARNIADIGAYDVIDTTSGGATITGALTSSNLSDGTNSVPTDTVVNGSAKAWVNFNGTGTIAARDSENVSSLTDNGTGDYTVDFTLAMADANYSYFVSSSGAYSTTSVLPYGPYINATASTAESAPTTSSFRFCTSRQAGFFDPKYINAAAFR